MAGVCASAGPCSTGKWWKKMCQVQARFVLAFGQRHCHSLLGSVCSPEYLSHPLFAPDLWECGARGQWGGGCVCAFTVFVDPTAPGPFVLCAARLQPPPPPAPPNTSITRRCRDASRRCRKRTPAVTVHVPGHSDGHARTRTHAGGKSGYGRHEARTEWLTLRGNTCACRTLLCSTQHPATHTHTPTHIHRPTHPHTHTHTQVIHGKRTLEKR